MVKFELQIKATMENITNLRADGDDFRWYLKLKCMNCGEESEKWHYVTITETVPVKGSRGESNLITKCKLCARENSLNILKGSNGSYTIDDENSFKSIVAFEVRGMEPIDFSPRIGFVAEGSESGTKFTDINLQEKEWVEYDEKAAVSVGIYNLEHRFVKA